MTLFSPPQFETKVFVYLGDDRFLQTYVAPKYVDKPKRVSDPLNWVHQFLDQAPDIESKVDSLCAALSECALGTRLQQPEFYEYIKERVEDALDIQFQAGGSATWRMFRLGN